MMNEFSLFNENEDILETEADFKTSFTDDNCADNGICIKIMVAISAMWVLIFIRLHSI